MKMLTSIVVGLVAAVVAIVAATPLLFAGIWAWASIEMTRSSAGFGGRSVEATLPMLVIGLLAFALGFRWPFRRGPVARH